MEKENNKSIGSDKFYDLPIFLKGSDENRAQLLKKLETYYIKKRDEKAISMLNHSSIVFKFRFKRAIFRASRHNGQR